METLHANKGNNTWCSYSIEENKTKSRNLKEVQLKYEIPKTSC